MNRRVGEVALVAIAIVLSLMGVLSENWFGARLDEGTSVDVGLRDVVMCQAGECRTLSLRNLEASRAVTMSGNVAYFAAILGAVLGVLAGGLSLGGRRVIGPISPARLAAAFFAASALGGLVFLISQPGDGSFSIGTAGPLAIAGGVFGTIGAIMMALAQGRAATPLGYLDAAPAAPIAGVAAMSPACPQCAAPTTLNTQHQRWYCAGCRAYV